MADYGHELLFGSFLTPAADRPAGVLALARLSEQLGLDLVTVQDHPYQAAFLDAWTLLSVIAGQTSTVRVVPNVTNLPLRPPAVLARAVASLDLLSGGRVELGLGAGAFWDAIFGMGGTRRSPGESVDALAEAIAVIRSLWAPGRVGVQFDGQHYQLHGARPGPVPAHDVGIWVGAYKPRMLRLTGRLADGWLPSAGHAGPDELTELNAQVDRAAAVAGRAPEDIRRLYNISGSFTGPGREFLRGPATTWARQLTELALRDGMSGFILGGDDPDDLRRFAAEVAPAVRVLVQAERAGAGPGDGTTET